MSDKIKIGILGLGRAGFGMQCNELDHKADKFEIVAGCDSHKPWCKRLSERYPACKTYDEVDDFLKDEQVRLVTIATRSVDHFLHGKLALEAGKNIIIDKPMCISYEQSVALKELAVKYDRGIYVRHNRRFDNDFVFVKEFLETGKLGDIHTIKLTRTGFSRRKDWQTLKSNGGGQLLNWGPHIIDHALQFLKLCNGTASAEICYSELKQLLSAGDCEDHVKILLRSNGSCVVEIEISDAVAINIPEYIIWGTRGSLVLSVTDQKVSIKYLDPSFVFDDLSVDNGVPGSSRFGADDDDFKWIEESMPIPENYKYDFWDAIYDAENNLNPFPVKIDEAIEVMRIITKATELT